MPLAATPTRPLQHPATDRIPTDSLLALDSPLELPRQLRQDLQSCTPRIKNRVAAQFRRTAARASRERLIFAASFLPPAPAALVRAYYDYGMTIHELARVHHLKAAALRRRLRKLRIRLDDPYFLMAAQLGDQLPPDLAALAKDHWLQDHSLRRLAHQRRETVHRIRQQLAEVRSLLLVLQSAKQPSPQPATDADH